MILGEIPRSFVQHNGTLVMASAVHVDIFLCTCFLSDDFGVESFDSISTRVLL
jgi:hypothetical protein